MNKLRFETPDMVSENIDKIAALFPSAITEMRGEDGEIKRGVNFEVLKQLLSRDVVDGDECYEFTWVGKKAAMAEAARPITKTLRPVKADSRDWDTTENLYIEGDNLEVLKILQESYLGKVKMIYIDPPYNTGSDKFVYSDSFLMDKEEYEYRTGLYNADGDRTYKENNYSNPQFHSDWCSMIYARLVLARNYLSEDGLIFISIDSNEYEHLKCICDEVFGGDNLICTFVWHNNKKGRQMDKYIKNTTEYILMYAKCKEMVALNEKSCSVDTIDYPFEDGISAYKKGYPLHNGTAAFHINNRPNLCYSIYVNRETEDVKIIDEKIESENGWILSTSEKGKQLVNDGYIRIVPKINKKYGTQRVWRWGKERFLSEYKTELVLEKEDDGYYFYQKERLNSDGTKSMKYTNYIDIDTSRGRTAINELFDNKPVFDFPKPVDLVETLLRIVANNKEMIICDFFSGSATTAHAVMQLNAEDGGHRKFIMVQLPEKCDEASEAYKAGYKNICEIGKERIRRAGDKIKSEHPDAKLDTGFRVFRVDESNMEDIYYHPEELTQTMLGSMVSNIKPDRTDLDLLYACLLDWGVEISLSHTQAVIDGCTVHNVDNGALCACFDERVPLSVIDYIAKQQPLRAVFRDSSFAADDSKINVTEIFKNLSPDTKVKVI